MIPDQVKELLEQPLACMLGSCNAQLRTGVHRCYGFTFDDTHLSLYVAGTDLLRENVASNKALAANLNHIVTHECYQFKGTLVEITEPTPEQLAYAEERANAFGDLAATIGYPKEVMLKFMRTPSAVVRMEIKEIFVQTPGPGAGARIVPPAEAS